MKRKSKIIICVWVTFLIAVVGISFGVRENVNYRAKKHDEKKKVVAEKKKVSYSGMGNIAGNTENGGLQTLVSPNKILLEVGVSETSGTRMCYFDVDTQELQFACDISGCIHNDTECQSCKTLNYLLSYGDEYYGVSQEYTKEILKFKNGEGNCIYKGEHDIYGIWAYDGFLYYMTDYGVYRMSIQSGGTPKKVLKKPILFENLTFYKNKMYYVTEDMFLYSCDLDGSNGKLLIEEMALSPQIYKDRIYFRSAEYNKKGAYDMDNSLCYISLNGKGKTVVRKNVYQYCILEDEIYYEEIPQNGETVLKKCDIDGKDATEICECQSGYLYIHPESDWIIVQKTEGALNAGEEGSLPFHYYCVKKDGTEEKRLEYPNVVE